MKRSMFLLVWLFLATFRVGAIDRVTYKGGPIMNTDPNGAKIYVIWYGNWRTAHPETIPLVENFYQHYASTDRFAVNRLYADSSGVPIPARLQWGGSVYDDAMVLGPVLPQTLPNPPYSTGAAIIEAQIAAGAIERDTNAIYAIWLGENVSLGYDCHCQAWHSWFTDSFGNRLKYNVMPFYTMVARRSGQSDFPGIAYGGPLYLNGDPVSMAMLEKATHELDDTLIDPEINAWYLTSGGIYNQELGDPCFNTYAQPWPGTAPNGVPYDVQVGDYYYIVQMRLFNFGKSPYCLMSVPVNANFAPNGTSSTMRGDARLSGAGKMR